VARAVLDTIAAAGADGPCTIIGTGRKASFPNAVLANGTLIRVLDLNDYVMTDGIVGGHPSDNIAVALAAGELANRSGRDVLTGIILAYELYGRVRRLVHRHIWDGVTASGIAAATVGGSLLGLDRDRLAHALALSAAVSATPAIVRGGHISAAKSIANALVAQSAAQAVLLAANGVTGPLAAIEHPQGLRAVFSPDADLSTLTSPLPAVSHVMRAHVKRYPCVATAQSGVAAAVELHRLLPGRIEDVAAVTVTMADGPSTREHQSSAERRDPRSREAADHSLHFLIAVALIDGELGTRQFDGERWHDPAIRQLMGKLQFRTDPAWPASAGQACRIEAVTGSGQGLHAEVPFPPGFSRDGLDERVVLEKFHESCDRFLARGARDAVVDAVMTLDQSASCRPLLDRIGVRAMSAV
jgi:2-methylcitrate dehydratase